MKRAKPERAPGKPANAGAQSPVLVIGVGNPLRGDDAAGRIVAARVKRRALPFVKVVECSGEGTDLMEFWADAGTVIVVDAVSSGAAAGTVQRFDATREPLPIRFHAASTHSFGLGEAVELARALHQLPKRLIVYGIEGKQFEAGSKLSPGVKRVLPSVAGQILKEARSAGEARPAASHFPVTKVTDARPPAPDTHG